MKVLLILAIIILLHCKSVAVNARVLANYRRNPLIISRRARPTVLPEFLLSHTIHTGIDINHGMDTVVDGFLNIRHPSKPKKLWDMNGYLRTTRNHVWYHYGHLLRPVNKYNLTESAIAELALHPFFRQLRGTISKRPLMILPRRFIPVRCKPPVCNPYLHTWANGIEVEPGNDFAVEGMLDFPVSAGEPDVELRFPLQGMFVWQKVPIRFIYGQHMTPVNPFRRKCDTTNCKSSPPFK
ncbi:hypothetical protein T05_3857 [Trichinella murrelli]|uniref:Uncharacterized protein n=1 Tax=Trichinella murrelli TaxID=144512 RepID=A0A0V0TT54_9BILA|nr:hypothetical protein T05_3857 [Trichinella murrelli]